VTSFASKPVVFIHTNDSQLLPAKVGAHALRSRSQHVDAFEIRILRVEETPQLLKHDGQQHVWNGGLHTWRSDAVTSFMPLRRMVPQAMGFRGRALVIDPDVFAVGDVFELLSRDMDGMAIVCDTMIDELADVPCRRYATSVMLLDCAKLEHWQWDREIDAIFRREFDFGPWIGLLTEPAATIGMLEEEWNHCDTLNERTKLLHNTERPTQPWKTGLPMDPDLVFIARRRARARENGGGFVARALRAVGVTRVPAELDPVNRPHPDPRQERLFFSLLAECLANGEITEEFLRDAIRRGHMRPDAFHLLQRTSP
jgi:hypothetical protein